jgi:DNA-directed RNA polymerase specialized sigma subunit
MDRGVNIPFNELGGYERDRRPGTSQDFEEQCVRVEAIMSTMPQTLELVGTWYYIDNLTLAQIGKRLGCGVTQAFRHVQHFKQKFKERWDHAEFR